MRNRANYKKVILYSGGLDSSYLVGMSVKKREMVKMVFINYGQKHYYMEKGAGERVINELRKRSGWASRKLDDVDEINLGDLFHGCGLLVGSEVKRKGNDGGLSDWYLPGRNFVMILVGVIYAIRNSIDIVECGFNRTDYNGFVDCRPEVIEKFIDAIIPGLGGYVIDVVLPLVNKEKKDIIREMVDEGYSWMIDYTYSCYNGVVGGCGWCDACLERRRARELVGITG